MNIIEHRQELAEMIATATKMKELSDSILKRVDYELSALEAKQEKLRQVEKVMEENCEKKNNQVILNVGGKIFITSKSTLLLHSDTYFTGLLSTSEKFSVFILITN